MVKVPKGKIFTFKDMEELKRFRAASNKKEYKYLKSWRERKEVEK